MKTKTQSGPSILKWSSKPADHNAIRVRNNQRRHRARAKGHIEDLEKRLEETSSRLEAALQTISHLAQEVEILRGHTTVAPPTAETEDSADCGCDGLPPQAPGESTLPCSSAFRIIEQQNFSGVEVTTIRAWLGPGFRKALKPGEACRVETNRVYELLDHITSSS
ncbi:hypothetical protein SLS64_011975 [Diaporthe eres]|uniref:BZIP domain-containing protein n=1 Tax=Diaporthe eres TaxID=83184 RepID=A0ABR1NUR9_DIAER